MHSVERARVQWLGVALVAAGAATSAAASPELARKHGCTGCHAMDEKVVGPSFTDVAERYRNMPAAAERMAKHIRSGVSGLWGPVPMPGHPQIAPEEADLLAKWVLASKR
jgi:cytochrome c